MNYWGTKARTEQMNFCDVVQPVAFGVGYSKDKRLLVK